MPAGMNNVALLHAWLNQLVPGLLQSLECSMSHCRMVRYQINNVCRSRAENGQEDRASLHSGERVQQGEKWIASRWLQEQAVCSTDGPSTVEE